MGGFLPTPFYLKILKLPILSIKSNKLDFDVIECLDTKSISIIDKSEYLDIRPDKPTMEVLAPGFSEAHLTPWRPFNINIINAGQLNIGCGPNVNLPDGIYCLTLRVCPQEEVYLTKTYLKTDLLEYELDDKLLMILSNKFISEEIKRKFQDIDLLILSAKAHARNGNTKEATSLYSKAQKYLNKINCK